MTPPLESSATISPTQSGDTLTRRGLVLGLVVALVAGLAACSGQGGQNRSTARPTWQPQRHDGGPGGN